VRPAACVFTAGRGWMPVGRLLACAAILAGVGAGICWHGLTGSGGSRWALGRAEVTVPPRWEGGTDPDLPRHPPRSQTWMIADGILEAAQDLRVGHLMADKVRKTYSHVAASSRPVSWNVFRQRCEA
jgi:hypothetical protein